METAKGRPRKASKKRKPKKKIDLTEEEIRIYAKSLAVEVIDNVVDIIRDPDARDGDKVNAAKLLLERGLGKVPTIIPDDAKEVINTIGIRILTPEDIEQKKAEAKARRESLKNG